VNFKARGAFGIGNYGAGGLTSGSTMKVILGYGDEDTPSNVNQLFRKNLANPSKINSNFSGNIGLGGGLQTFYQYSNGSIFGSPNLTGLNTRETVGIDASFRYLKASLKAEGTWRINGGLNTGYDFSQNLAGEKLPTWLATFGYVGGIAGDLERQYLTAGEYRRKYLGRNYPSSDFNHANLKNGLASGPEGNFSYSLINAGIGSALAALGPASVAGINGQNPNGLAGSTLSSSQGIQIGARVSAAYLFYGLAGVDLNVADRATRYLKGAKAGSWEDTFFANVGVALPLGGAISLLSYYHTWQSQANNASSSASAPATTTAAPGLGASQAGTATNDSVTSKGGYHSAGTGAAYPFSYAPASASNSYFSSATSGVALGAAPSKLQQLTLNTTQIGAINPPPATNSGTANTGGFPLTLFNQGENLNDGTYKDVPILGVTISGNLDTAALASFTVANHSIVASSFQITKAGTYLALPQNNSNSGINSGIYDLVLDVFSNGIANPPDPKNVTGDPFLNLPLISLDSSKSSTQLTSQPIQSIQYVAVPANSQSPSTNYQPYTVNPATNKLELSQQPSNNNESYTYNDIPVSLYNPSNLSTQIALLNNSPVTATVHISNGIIQRVELNQQLLFASSAPPSQYTLQLQLPTAVLSSSNPQPSYSVTSQNLAFNNFVDDEQFSAQAGTSNSGVYLAAGLSDELPLTPAMGVRAVQNRVAYVSQEQKTINGKLETVSNIVYLNGIERYSLADNPGVYYTKPQPVVTPSQLSLENYYINANTNTIEYYFTAASSPTAVSIAGPPSSATSSIAGDTFVAWVEASDSVIPLSTTEGGEENYQHFMKNLYGSQRINYRINNKSNGSWESPNLTDLYYPTNAVIRNLKAFNVANPYPTAAGAGPERTLLVWSETSIEAIKGEVQAIGSGSSIPTVIKAGWINPNPTTYQWNDLFLDDNNNSTIQVIPWDPTKDVGLTIDDISIASLPLLANGSLAETPVVSWSQNVRTPYRQSVLDSSPLIYLQFGQLQTGANDINIGSIDSASTITTASSTGLNFAIAGALPSSQATAVQNSDGTGVLSTGTGSNFAQVSQLINSIPAATYTPASDPNAIAHFTGSITDFTLTVSSLTSGSLDVGDLISGPGIIAGTTIKAQGSLNPATGLTTYILNQKQAVASTALEAVPAPTQLPINSFSGSITGNTLTVTSTAPDNSLHLGDLITGQGITPGTTITAIGDYNVNNGTGSVTVSNSQSVATSALVATPGSPTVPYTIEFWAKLPQGSNPNGAGLVALGQPSDTAIGAPTLPEGWLLNSSLVVDQITYSQALSDNLITSIPITVTAPSTTVYGWGWAMLADGANTTATNGSGNNLYNNALEINNLVNGATIPGVTNFLNNYQLTSSQLLGLDGTNTITSISQAPLTQLQFNNYIDTNNNSLPNSSLNSIAIDTSSAVINKGFVSANAAQGNANLNNMFNDLWAYQQKTGEAKVNFSLAPNSAGTTGTPPNKFSSESYSGYELGFSLNRGTAVSINGSGQLVFDVGKDTSLTASTAVDGSSADLRDGNWHYIVASYLPDYQAYTVAGTVTQVPSNVGTASLYVDNQLVASSATNNINPYVIDAYAPVNFNDQALLLANNAGASIDQLAFYDKALSTATFKPNSFGRWPSPSADDALAGLAALGTSIATKTPDPGAIPGAVSSHWNARNVNPNDALLGTYYSVFTPDATGLTGSWSNASNLNPNPKLQATTPSASQPGSLQDELMIAVPASAWTQGGGWTLNGALNSGVINPAKQTLTGVQLTLTNKSQPSSTPIQITLNPEQVLLGNNTIKSLQPLATNNNFSYTLPTNTPAFNLLVSKKDLQVNNKFVFSANDEYSATYAFSFAPTAGSSASNVVANANPVSFNAGASVLASSRGTGLATQAALNKPIALFTGSITGTSLQVSSTSQGQLKVGDLIIGPGVASGTKITAIGNYNSSTGIGSFTVNNTQTVNSANLAVKGYTSALATAAVIEQAPLQLKYVDSGEVLKSSSSTAAANSPAVASPANTFGTSQVAGSFTASNGNSAGWIAIAQPQSTNASSNPAGRIWIQYTGQSLNGKPTTDTANAPSTWLNALAQSNFSPDSPNLPLLANANYPSSTGGLLIQADPTVGWAENFGQTMLSADFNNDGIADLVIGAPQAIGGGRVYIIDGKWIQNNLTTANIGSTILSLANTSGVVNPNNIGGYVTVLTPASVLNSTEVAAFGSALAFDPSTSTLWIGAPNYLSQLDPSNTSTPLSSTKPIGALYSYSSSSNGGWDSGQPTPLGATTLGSGGTASSLDPTGAPTTSYWGSQFGSAIAVDGNGGIAVSAPGVYAAMLYSGTEKASAQAMGEKNPSDKYGDGALVKIGLPTVQTGSILPTVSIANGTSSGSLIDIISQDKSTEKQNGAEETTYMQNLKALQLDNIATATTYYNQALQVNAVGAVYLIKSSANLKNIANITATTVGSLGGSTYYGPNPWNTLGSSGFGSSLAFGDLKNTNSTSILAIGANQTGGSGAVYLIDSKSKQPTSILGNNQYLAHLASGLTLYGAQAQDNFGNGLLNLGDINGDGYNDLLIQAFNASSGAGNGYVLFGSDNLISTDSTNPGSGNVAPGTIGQITRADGFSFKAAILSELGYGQSSYTGQGTFGAGDINGDGLNDISLGSGPNGTGYLTWGHPYLEAINNLQLSKLASNTGYMLNGLATSTQGSLRSIGDFNGDGYGDFISIQPGEQLTTIRIELGANTQEVLADYPYNFYSFTVSNNTQVSAAGDINGDGFADIALFIQQNLSPYSQGAGSTTGILYGRSSKDLPIGSGFGFLAPVDQNSQPLAALPGQDIANGLTNTAPAVINVGNTIYSVVKGYNNNNLYFAQSNDAGNTWSNWQDISSSQPGLTSNSAPSLAFYNNKLYLAFLNTAATPTLSLSSWDPTSNNPAAWTTPNLLSNAANPSASYSSSLSPQLINRGDALGVAWVATPDAAPINWSPLAGGASPSTPALARNGNTVYMATQGINNTIQWTSSTDGGATWANWQQLPNTMTSASPPSLAVMNGTLYLSYISNYNDTSSINITSLANAASNGWNSSYTIPSTYSPANASLIVETVAGSQQLAVYYVAGNTNYAANNSKIFKTYSTSPDSSTGWASSQWIENQYASGPLALTSYNGQTYVAYQAGTISSPANTIYLTTSTSAATTNTGYEWSAQIAANPNTRTGLGLTNNANGLILSYGDSSSPNALQLKQFTAQGAKWTQSNALSEPLPATLSNNVSILNLDGSGNTGLLLAGVNTTANGNGVQTGSIQSVNLKPSLYASYSTTPDGSSATGSWSLPSALQERLDSNGNKTFEPINATQAPSITWLGQTAVAAVNNNGTINVYAAIANSQSWKLASSFTAASGSSQINTAPVLATTDTGLALTYGSSDGAIHLQRLDLLDAKGNLIDGNPPWVSTILNQANGGITSNLASVPLSIDGNLLLTNVRNSSQNNQIWLNAIPTLGDPASSTWLNSTVQLPNGIGGWNISQQTGTVNIGTISPAWQSLPSGQSPDAPSFAQINGVLYSAVLGTNNYLYWRSSTDGGLNWQQPWTQLPDSFTSTQAPSLAAINDTLYLSYIGDGNTEINITSLLDIATNDWSSQYQIPNQEAQFGSLINENGTLALYYEGTNNTLYRTATNTPSQSSSWSSSEQIKYNNGNSNQTASGPIAISYLNGSTYIAYQGGSPGIPSNSIYLSSSSNQSSSTSWSIINNIPQATNSTHSGVGLTVNADGLLLSYADQINDTPVIVLQQGIVSNNNWSGSIYSTLAAPGATQGSAASIFSTSASPDVLVAAIDANSAPVSNAITTTIARGLPSSLVLTAGQTGSSLAAPGDLNNDGYDDLIVSANNVIVGGSNPSLATGMRVISGAANSTILSSINNANASSQIVHLAPSFGANGSTPVTSFNGFNPTKGTIDLSIVAAENSQVSAYQAAIKSANLFSGANSINSAGSLFYGIGTSNSQDLQFNNGWGQSFLNSNSSYGDLNADGILDFLDPAGNYAIDTADGSLSYNIWSIKAAGDVNGNGLDDVVLALAPNGPAYVRNANGTPSSIASVLVDGGLFKVDKTTNSFRLDNLRTPLNPFSKNEIYDVTSKSTNNYLPLLQNWFDPILNFQPGALTGVSTGTAVNVAGGKSQSAPAAVVDELGNLGLIFSGYTSGSGIWMATQNKASGSWSQFSLGSTNQLTNIDYQSSPSATFYNGNLYLAYRDSSGYLWIAHTKANTNGQPTNYSTATWNKYQVITTANESTAYSPALVVEEGRLALYFASNTSGTGTQSVRYLYSNNPDAASPSWGSNLASNSSTTATNSLTPPYVGESAILNFDYQGSPSGFICDSSISATTYQGRTVLAFRGDQGGAGNNNVIRLATAPSANPTPSENWLYYSTSQSNDYNSGYVGLTTDQSLLYLSTSLGNFSTQIYSLSPTQAGNYGNYTLSTGYAGPTGVNFATSANIFMKDGKPMATWASNYEDNIELASLNLTVSAPSQQSLSGYSVDGNIDVNGDGFTDVLISDPSNPQKGVDNQYVLFGGDYLDIASQVGSAANDTLIGTPLADVIYALSGADVVQSNGGADVIYTGSGDDQISIINSAFIRIDAGSGFDQLLLQGEVNQNYDFSLNLGSTQYFVGTKLQDVELISSQGYGANALRFDAASVNAINPDRILFLAPDASDTISLSSEFVRNSSFDTSYAAGLWYAYAAGSQVAASSNPTLVYVRVPDGSIANTWLPSNVNTTAAISTTATTNPGSIEPLETVFNTLSAAGIISSTSFGNDLTITSYRANANASELRFRITRNDASKRQLLTYASTSLDGTAEPGKDYTPAIGLLALEVGQNSADITVPMNAAAIKALRTGSLSLNVEEIPNFNQNPFHLLLQNPLSTKGQLASVISGLELINDYTNNSASISFRSDTNATSTIGNSVNSLNLNLIRRVAADAAASNTNNRSQLISIADGAAASYDLDLTTNKQVAVKLNVDLTAKTDNFSLVASSGAPQVLSALNPKSTAALALDATNTSANPDPITAVNTNLDTPPGANSQQQLSINSNTALLDFTGFSKNQTVAGTLTLARDASYDAITGFYRSLDSQGTVLDAIGNRLRPGDNGYQAAALRPDNLVSELANLQVGNQQSSSSNINIKINETTGFLAPYALVNTNIFFAFGAANSDKINHFRSLDSNTIGLEDMTGGGDNDFNDHTIKFNLSSLA